MLEKEAVLRGGADATLGGDALRRLFTEPLLSQTCQHLVAGGEQFLGQCTAVIGEVLQDRSHQQAIRRKGMPAAVEARFDPELGYPHAFLCEQPPLHLG
ncbi:MAG: hypothetical protein IPM68_10755 [Flavobacteriales bacterium]|nr:hypothetical protein [Flavobacteriales bacterium]